MKRLLLSLFIFSNSFVYSQDYTPMLELDKIWNMHHYDNAISANDYDFNITLNAIVSINGIDYFQASNGDYFRENVQTKKVYQLIDNVDELILDFDLNIGDELHSPLIYIDENTYSRIITNIGTGTLYGSTNLKFYQTECGETIIEGIGIISKGLFDISTSCSTFDYDTGETLINMNVLSLNDFDTQNNISLFFNSNTKELQLTKNNYELDIEIYTILGKQIIKSKITSVIDASKLQKGIYYYSLSSSNTRKKGNILITN